MDTSAHVRRVIRELDSQRKEVDKLLPRVRGEMKQDGLLAAQMRMREAIKELLRAA